MTFSFRDRKNNIERFKNEVFDLVIVGGGITGAGIARDATSRGMKVALLEANDFASGTSSRSSKLIHGGVRYLENFEFHLVFEALAERALLFKIAPHLVHPLRFLIPIYKNSRVGYWKMLAGMWLYDLLALFETPQMHESLDPSQVEERLPSLNHDELVGAMEYSDAYTDDDRLVIESLRDAARRDAVMANYTHVESASWDGDRISHLQVLDHVSGEKFSVRGHQFVSGVGPWTDIFGKSVDVGWKDRLRPTKGVHLTFSRDRIPVEKAVVMAVESRIIFVIPRHEMVIVGTTDTDFSNDPATVLTQVDDVHYLLAALNQYFPDLKIQQSDILASYSGVRPLVDDGSSTEGKTSREHSIWSHGENLTFVAGGKYTTYRKISEEAVDHILSKLPFEVAMAFGPSNTKVPLNPQLSVDLYDRARQSVAPWSVQYGIDEKVVLQLVERHGLEAQIILQKMADDYGLYPTEEARWMGEAYFAIEHGMCLSLVDFYWRRSPLFLATKDHGVQYLNVIAKVFAESLGWSSDEQERQKEAFHQQMAKELSWDNLLA